MATLNELGHITACCPTCNGALSTFEWKTAAAQFGAVRHKDVAFNGRGWRVDHRLFRCAGCGAGALGRVAYSGANYPDGALRLLDFYLESAESFPVPDATPPGIKAEFREAEKCISVGALQAAAGLFRSVLDKTLRANGYKVAKGTTLEQQIDMAGADGVITAARLRRAHDEVRVLGNDVLHDEWRPIPKEDVQAAHLYAQRILEDFYDERESVLAVLRDKGRVPVEDAPKP